MDYRFLLEDPSRAERATSAGVSYGVWTVDDVASARALLDLGVRDFTTNEVQALLSWRDDLG